MKCTVAKGSGSLLLRSVDERAEYVANSHCGESNFPAITAALQSNVTARRGDWVLVMGELAFSVAKLQLIYLHCGNSPESEPATAPCLI